MPESKLPLKNDKSSGLLSFRQLFHLGKDKPVTLPIFKRYKSFAYYPTNAALYSTFLHIPQKYPRTKGRRFSPTTVTGTKENEPSTSLAELWLSPQIKVKT